MDTTVAKNELLSLAELELSYYEELVFLATKQRDILVNNRHSELPDNLAKQDSVLVELARIDHQIKALSENISKTHEEFSGDFERRRKQISEKLQKTVSQLRWLVQINAELLVNAKKFIDFSVRTIVSLATEQVAYSSHGEPAGRAFVLDKKV